MQAFICLIVIFGIGEYVSIYLRRRHERAMARMQRIEDAYDTWEHADILLDEWRSARPFLYVSQCEYARSLVWEMIKACEEIAAYNGHPPDEMEYLALLHDLLEDKPPPDDEPQSPDSSGLCL